MEIVFALCLTSYARFSIVIVGVEHLLNQIRRATRSATRRWATGQLPRNF